MLSEQRYKEILNVLNREGSVKTSTLCALLGTSRETIRRDLENLEARNLLRRIHGGAMGLEEPGEPSASYTSFDKRRMENARFTEWISSLGAGKRTWREDRESRKKFRFFSCPNCRARVRVPKGKGKIIITCPMCRKEFIKKT